MKKIVYFVILFTTLLSAQEVLNAVKIDANYFRPDNQKWGNDLQIIDHEPSGMIDGIQTNSGQIYLGILDSIQDPNVKFYILTSIDTGRTWQTYGLGLGIAVDKFKIIHTSSDTVIVFALFQGHIMQWITSNIYVNFISNAPNILDFDVVAGPDNSIHLFYTSQDTIKRFTSTNGGRNWNTPATVGTNARYAQLGPNLQGDTILCALYSRYHDYGIKGPIYKLLYSQSPSGTLSVINGGYLTNINDTNTYKSELKCAYGIGQSMILHTEGTLGAIDIAGYYSPDKATNYTPVAIANTTKDEYWFDLKTYNSGVAGFDMVYYTDSLQVGNPNSNTDYLNYQYTVHGSDIAGMKKFSSHIPFWSFSAHKPKIIELENADNAIVWVGYDSFFNKAVYWNRYSMPTAVNELGTMNNKDFSLMQNYPNPFNPNTKITFDMKKESKVSLKVYDALGREIAVLINEIKPAGHHTVNFDGKDFTSGVYFYKLNIDGFVQTKKMILLK